MALLGLPEKINVEGYELVRRSVFHITLAAVGKIMEKHKVSASDFLNKVIDDFCEFTKTNNIDLLRYRDEFRFAAQDEKRSVVAMCDVFGLDKFFQLLNQKYSLAIECPPTHVTLYTLEPDAGIFLVDSHDINKFTRPIINSGITISSVPSPVAANI